MRINESAVEDATLEWLEALGYTVGHVPLLAPGEPAVERDSFAEIILVPRLRAAIQRINPKLQFAFGGTNLVEGCGFRMRTFGEAATKHGLPGHSLRGSSAVTPNPDNNPGAKL